MNVIKSSTRMQSNTSNRSLLETECLFGETIEILDQKHEWVYCKLVTDNYCGWLKKNSLGKLKLTTHRIINKRTFIYRYPDAKSLVLTYLPMGSRITVEEMNFGWAETSFLINNKLKIGYVPSTHIVDVTNKVKDWVSQAQQLEGVPYKWGGRDTIGIDCSALLQLSYQTYGQLIPRNTAQQVNLKKRTIKNMEDLKRGCVVFWKGHVGIMIDSLNCIHSNAYHMKTTTEPLVEINRRMGDDGKIVKMMDFN